MLKVGHGYVTGDLNLGDSTLVRSVLEESHLLAAHFAHDIAFALMSYTPLRAPASSQTSRIEHHLVVCQPMHGGSQPGQSARSDVPPVPASPAKQIAARESCRGAELVPPKRIDAVA